MAVLLYKNESWLRYKYVDEALSTYSIGKLLGVHNTTIFSWLRRFGIPTRSISKALESWYDSSEGLEKRDLLRTASKSRVGEHSPNYGRTFSDEHRRRMSESGRGRVFSDEHRRRLGNAKRGISLSDDHKRKISEAGCGEKHYNWQGGKSFEPYCYKFNDTKKEEVREKYDRKCFLCGAPENGRKHSVHHTDYNKMQGCDAKSWNLLPLCPSCHAKTNGHRWYWFGLLYNHWAMNTEINFNAEEFVWNRF